MKSKEHDFFIGLHNVDRINNKNLALFIVTGMGVVFSYIMFVFYSVLFYLKLDLVYLPIMLSFLCLEIFFIICYFISSNKLIKMNEEVVEKYGNFR